MSKKFKRKCCRKFDEVMLEVVGHMEGVCCEEFWCGGFVGALFLQMMEDFGGEWCLGMQVVVQQGRHLSCVYGSSRAWW